MSEILYRLVPKEQQEHISSSSTAEEIVKVFFFLDESKVDVLQFEDVLQELLRRVTVFHDTLSQSSTMYDLLSEAYSYSTLKPNKVEYEKLNAQWYISYLLFGSNDKESLSHEEILAVYERVTKLFWHIKNPIAKEILTKLEDIIEQWYDSKEKNILPEFEDIDRELHYQFEYIEKGTLYMDNLLSSSILMAARKNFLDESYEYHAGYESRWEDEKKYKYTKQEYTELFDKLIELTKLIEVIQTEEEILENKVIQLLKEEKYWDIFDSSFEDMIRAHIKKYTTLYKTHSGDDSIAYWKEWYWIYIPVSDENVLDCTYWNVKYNISGVDIEDSKLNTILWSYTKYRSLKAFDNYFGTANYEKIESDKKKVWAKWAYMNELKAFLEKYEKYPDLEDDMKFMRWREFTVPPFELSIAQQYIDWRNNWKLDDTYFRNLYAAWEKKEVKIIVRSSAMYSEDNEFITGAGIYQSQVVEGNSYEEFCKAIECVFISCNSEWAQKYRKDNNIPNEYMGLVVQEYISEWESGHVNSIMQHRPELMEISFGKYQWVRPIIYKENIMDFIFWAFSQKDKSIYHYEIDRDKFDGWLLSSSRDLSIIVSILERYFRKPIQVEFVCKKQKEHSRRSNTISIVQVRPLPVSFSERYDINFLDDQQEIREWRALGVCDEEYDILTTGEDNTDKIGAVVFTANNYATLNSRSLEKSIPKKWVVIVENPGWTDGHIETLCAEKWVVCVFPKWGSRKEDFIGDMMNLSNAHALWLAPRLAGLQKNAEFKGHARVRIIADWLSSKIYEIEQ